MRIYLVSCRFFDDETMSKLNHIYFMWYQFIGDCEPSLEARLHLLHFQLEIELANFNLARDILSRIRAIFANESNDVEIVRLPNQFYCPIIIDTWIVSNEVCLVESLSHEKAVRLYVCNDCPAEQFDDIKTIILEFRRQNFETNSLTAFDQIEILSEGYWMAERFEDCYRWCEIGLHHSTCSWYECKANNNNQPISERCLQHIRFVWIYLQQLLQNNHNLCKFNHFFNLDFVFLAQKIKNTKNTDISSKRNATFSSCLLNSDQSFEFVDKPLNSFHVLFT